MNTYILLALLCICAYFLLCLFDGKSALVYDIESVQFKELDKKNKIKAEGTRIVCIGFYDYKTGKYDYCLYPNFRKFQRLARQRKEIIGFNSLSFDDRVCAENGITVKTTFDLYERVLKALKQQTKHNKRDKYGLDDLAQENLGEGKIKTKTSVEKLWNEGNTNDLIMYCLQDVKLTKGLNDRRKKIKDPNSRTLLNLEAIKEDAV